MADLVEAVEHELRGRGSRGPSFPTHIFTWGERRLDSDGPGAREGLRDGEVVLFDFGAVWRGLLLRLRPHGALRRAAGGVRAT